MKNISEIRTVQRSEAFLKIAGTLSIAVGRLPVAEEKKEALLLLYVSLLHEAESNAYLQGVDAGKRHAAAFQDGEAHG